MKPILAPEKCRSVPFIRSPDRLRKSETVVEQQFSNLKLYAKNASCDKPCQYCINNTFHQNCHNWHSWGNSSDIWFNSSNIFSSKFPHWPFATLSMSVSWKRESVKDHLRSVTIKVLEQKYPLYVMDFPIRQFPPSNLYIWRELRAPRLHRQPTLARSTQEVHGGHRHNMAKLLYS